jgi:hypothetical protein
MGSFAELIGRARNVYSTSNSRLRSLDCLRLKSANSQHAGKKPFGGCEPIHAGQGRCRSILQPNIERAPHALAPSSDWKQRGVEVKTTFKP